MCVPERGKTVMHLVPIIIMALLNGTVGKIALGIKYYVLITIRLNIRIMYTLRSVKGCVTFYGV